MYNMMKRITLTPEDTLKYLAIQAIDIFHDAKLNTGTDLAPNQVNREEMANLQANWLYNNNDALKIVKFKELYGIILNNMNRFMSGDRINLDVSDLIDGNHSFTVNDYRITDVNRVDINGIQAIVDQCERGNNTSIICANKGKAVSLSQSILYDQGARLTNCGKRNTLSLNIGCPASRIHYFANNKNMYNDCVINDCNGYTIGNLHSVVIEGVLPLSRMIDDVNDIAVIVAKFGARSNMVQVEDTSRSGVRNWIAPKYIETLIFESQVSPNTSICRGFAPSKKILMGLYQELCDNYGNLNIGILTIPERLLVWNELMAKHWGDLGMICEAMGTNLYVLSGDQVVKYMCAFFGVNYIDNNDLYTKNNTTRQPIVKWV
jgi:hypothetical protein